MDFMSITEGLVVLVLIVACVDAYNGFKLGSKLSGKTEEEIKTKLEETTGDVKETVNQVKDIVEQTKEIMDQIKELKEKFDQLTGKVDVLTSNTEEINTYKYQVKDLLILYNLK